MDLNDSKLIKSVGPNQHKLLKSPLLMSLMFYNTRVSQKLRLMVETAVQDCLTKYFDNNDKANEDGKVFEQNSAIQTNEDDNVSEIVVSCSHIYADMMIDRVGMPLNHKDPIKTQWYGAPHYDQLFLSCQINNDETTNGKTNQLSLEPPRSGKACFNCDSVDHEISKCPTPKDFARINAKKREFLSSFSHSSMNPNDLKYRYHDEPQTTNPYHGCEPGKISEELRSAMNLKSSQLPLYVYRMRIYGYPPGYRIDHTEDRNINMIEKNDANAFSDTEDSTINQRKDVSEILYPGFNAPMPEGVYDEGIRRGFPRLRHCHRNPISSNDTTKPTDTITKSKSIGSLKSKSKSIGVSKKIDSSKSKSIDKSKKIGANRVNSESSEEIDDSSEAKSSGECSTDDIIYVGSNFENIYEGDSIQIQRCRSWYVEPLSISMFVPKPTWRRPPMLESYENYKEPEVTLENLKSNQLIPCDFSCLIFGDQSIPTERLKNIQAILTKMHTASKKTKNLRKS